MKSSKGPQGTRREWLRSAAQYASLPLAAKVGALAAFLPGTQALAAAQARSARPLRIAAAWENGSGYQVGVLDAGAAGSTRAATSELGIAAALDVPTRAHGVLMEKGGTLLAVARRPGDWLLRWSVDGQPMQWAWIEPDRAFNGHVIASADGKHLYTTESNLETGQGLIGVRDARSMEKLAEWPTHGMDPHELLLDQDGSLIVANGGVPALPETGRLKINLERMDASVVRLDARHGPQSGSIMGQWRLPDPRLSLRHIAWGQDPASGTRLLGIALQAEHADAASKQVAPVLAVFDGKHLKAVHAPQPLGGYGGDIAFADGCFAVSCPRANGVAWFRASAGAHPPAGHEDWLALSKLPEACALLSQDGHGRVWAAGRSEALAMAPQPAQGPRVLTSPGTVTVRVDNHWIQL
ncbi:DUF1513 domain-containing protein [Variovorax sp. VNK109]|uniref:DUF1513 domain-containing protein n=1 Tax=Variovorax sp. VNK109 TaxID=3400919 RepID=UPI003C0CFC12